MADNKPAGIGSERHIPPTYDKRGNPEWKSTMTKPDDSIAVIAMVPDRIIPIIFVPGVMGSNLKGIGAGHGTEWKLDSSSSMAGWMLKDAKARKTALTPATMEVDNTGALPTDTAQASEELKRRGWGEVGAMSYGPFLSWLENSLNEFIVGPPTPGRNTRDLLIGKSLGAMKGEEALVREAVALSYRYRFPVHACGYNWLDSNAVAAKRLKKCILDTIDRYRNTEKMKCEKVILVTHSMGGLVARHCSEVLNMKEKIFGIVHGVMPAIGAPAVYRRMKAGTELGDKGRAMKDKGLTEVLGDDSAEMTAVLSGAPGPLQLLPTPEYGNGWLCIKDRTTEEKLPKNGDPYGEIYTVRDRWWGLCEDTLINPLNLETDPIRKKTKMDADWMAFSLLIDNEVKQFHTQIKGKYHPITYAFFGSHSSKLSFDTVTWNRIGTPGNARPDPLSGVVKPGSPNLFDSRMVDTKVSVSKNDYTITRRYMLARQDGPGDGTVPHRSGIAPLNSVKSMLQVDVGHEPAYKDSVLAQQYTLRAIVQIAQQVNKTSLRYE